MGKTTRMLVVDHGLLTVPLRLAARASDTGTSCETCQLGIPLCVHTLVGTLSAGSLPSVAQRHCDLNTDRMVEISSGGFMKPCKLRENKGAGFFAAITRDHRPTSNTQACSGSIPLTIAMLGSSGSHYLDRSCAEDSGPATLTTVGSGDGGLFNMVKR